MPGSYKSPITIRQAIRYVDDSTFLLPAIQRNFVWSTQQICALFDSLMRGYPVNSFMTWSVQKPEIKNQYRFYRFLSDYIEHFKESNDYMPTKGDFKDFHAIIDGQQRLTSIYIGLKGTYAYKKPRVWWPKTPNPDVLPPRRLYLDLSGEHDSIDNEGQLRYRFRFLADQQVAELAADPNQHWFRVGEILEFNQEVTIDAVADDVVQPYISERGLGENSFARRALTRLYQVVNREPVITAYEETSQEIDHVLDVFIRTNSGGTPLEFADLLMSIAVSSWDGDARKDIDGLVAEVRQDPGMGFSIGRDWVLKTCLMLTESDVKFRVVNFDKDRVATIQRQWPEIRTCIVETMRLLHLIGLNDQSLRAKNAIIPIAYYLYRQRTAGDPRYLSINDLAHHRDDRVRISKWLNMAILKGVFGGQADNVLSRMRTIISEHLDEGAFPLDPVIDAYRNSNKDLRFSEEYIEGILRTQYGDARCRSVLALLYPDVNESLVFHMDHLHPASAFTEAALRKQAFLSERPELMEFYRDKGNWNSILNLHLLNASQNRSKSDDSLADWFDEKADTIKSSDILLSPDVSLRFEDFPNFIEERKKALSARMRQNVVVSEAFEIVDDLHDEEEDAQAA